MEGVGARLGRSSSRYGTTTVFTGPVRKWKKDWIPITPPSSSSSSSSNHSNNQNHQHSQPPPPSSSLANGSSLNGSNNGNVSHLRLFKWTPVSQKENSNNNDDNNVDNASPIKENFKDDDVIDAPAKKKFKYIPIALLEEYKKEAEVEEIVDDDDAKPTDADENSAEQAPKSDDYSEKPDINDVPMDEIQATEEYQTAAGRQDLNESLDLSLNLNSHEGDHDSDSITDPTKDV